jgi:hypothetical protein
VSSLKSGFSCGKATTIFRFDRSSSLCVRDLPDLPRLGVKFVRNSALLFRVIADISGSGSALLSTVIIIRFALVRVLSGDLEARSLYLAYT